MGLRGIASIAPCVWIVTAGIPLLSSHAAAPCIPPVCVEQDWNGSDVAGELLPGQVTDNYDNVTMPYIVYRPGLPDGSPWHANATHRLPVVFVLHGAESRGDLFADLTDMNLTADAHGFYVVYPTEDDSNGTVGCHCWRWYMDREQSRDGLRARMLVTIADRVTGTFHADGGIFGDPDRVYATGLSAGGAMTAILGAVYPDVFRKVAPAAALQFRGVVCPSALKCTDAELAMLQGISRDSNVTGQEAHDAMAVPRPASVPVLVFHGDDDAVVVPSNAANITHSFAQANDLLDGPAGAADDDSVDWLWDGCQHHRFADHDKDYRRMSYLDAAGAVLMERWMVDNMTHQWSGSDPIDPALEPFVFRPGPNQSEATWRFLDEGYAGLPPGPAEPDCADS